MQPTATSFTKRVTKNSARVVSTFISTRGTTTHECSGASLNTYHSLPYTPSTSRATTSRTSSRHSSGATGVTQPGEPMNHEDFNNAKSTNEPNKEGSQFGSSDVTSLSSVTSIPVQRGTQFRPRTQIQSQVMSVVTSLPHTDRSKLREENEHSNPSTINSIKVQETTTPRLVISAINVAGDSMGGGGNER